ncbi:hypothetical protein AALO_G00042670 [Alosa alosa]|uniref:Uncharacterized protein n=1 Tax=Alosa alosa TaxID=278164 RepID=A0AAV6H800_9TELE|nr:hypothetical protein AALO_G00042670 [Alosa alosa]
MGCTTSMILFDGLRSVLERNCGYVCKRAAVTGHLAESDSESEPTCSRRESQAWPARKAAKNYVGELLKVSAVRVSPCMV